ncbi:MAG: class I SAM-dependent methyltransferase [Aridibacter famidurans]|nr:class I SAM-dependent methyltransferase [Aridibacter famidurans]
MSNSVSESRPCPSCGPVEGIPVGEKNGFSILRCPDCRTIFTSQLPVVGEAEDYDSYYTEGNLSVPGFVRRRLGEILESFSPYRSSGRLLDVGFGAGTILQVASEKGWEAHGIEVSEPAIESAKKQGFQVFHGELSDANFPDAHFDVITASEILEHLPEPAELVGEISRILRPGGLFWATTPSSRGLSFRMMGSQWSVVSPPEHIQLFSRSGLVNLLSTSGFGEVKVLTESFNPSELKGFILRREDSFSGDDRVAAGYELNENLMSNGAGIVAKKAMNSLLNTFRLGDSLKIFAVKTS